jgi:AAA domain
LKCFSFRRSSNRVILSGGYTQHSSVEAGDAFRLLEKEAGVRLTRLTEIRRQTEARLQKGGRGDFARVGQSRAKGIRCAGQNGPYHRGDGREAAFDARERLPQSAGRRKSALIIAPTHAEGQKLTDELRAALKERSGGQGRSPAPRGLHPEG